MSHSESHTRQEIIDRQLAKAGWGINNRTLVEEYMIRVWQAAVDAIGAGAAARINLSSVILF
jgi:type I site-specific restriction endonuclease